MARITFTQNLERHLEAPSSDVGGATVREALDHVFESNPKLRSYVVDEHGRVRKHVVVFLDGEMIQDRIDLSDPVNEQSELFVMQALSGG